MNELVGNKTRYPGSGARWPVALALALFLMPFFAGTGAGPTAAAGNQETEVVVGEGDTLADIALRTLGDTNAAVEISAYNGLAADAGVTVGMKLKIPSSSDRKFAASAIDNIMNALDELQHIGVPSNLKAKEAEMVGILGQARASLKLAKYQEVIEFGDSAMSIANHLFENLEVRTVFDVEVRTGPDQSEGTSVFSVHKGKLRIDTPASSAILDEGQAGKIKGKTGKIAVASLPDPPMIQAPAEGLVFYEYNLNLAWKPPVPEIREFLLEIASDVRFSRIELEKIVKGSRAEIKDKLVDGTHYWRVACLTGDGTSGKWSDHRSFIMLFDREPPEVKIFRPIWK